MRVIKSRGDVKVEYNFSECPDCGDSIQTINNRVFNNGQPLTLKIAFCADCLEIKGWILAVEEAEEV